MKHFFSAFYWWIFFLQRTHEVCAFCVKFNWKLLTLALTAFFNLLSLIGNLEYFIMEVNAHTTTHRRVTQIYHHGASNNINNNQKASMNKKKWHIACKIHDLIRTDQDGVVAVCKRIQFTCEMQNFNLTSTPIAGSGSTQISAIRCPFSQCAWIFAALLVPPAANFVRRKF